MKKKNMNELGFQAVAYVIFLLITILCAYPFYYMLIYSLSSPMEALKNGVVFLPAHFTLNNYISIFKLPNIYTALLVSVIRVVSGTACGVIMTAMFAYVLTQKELAARKFFYRLTVISIYFNSGLIPWYITMKAYGLKNSFLLYLLPTLIVPFNLILVKTFIEQLPVSLQESAQIDGAGHLTIFFKLILPVSKPVVAAITVFTAVYHWNAWVDNLYLVNNPHLQTLQLTLLNYIREAENIAQSLKDNATTQKLTDITKTLTPMSIRITLTMFVTIPILLVYPFMQKYFIKGILLGSVKG